MLRLASGALQKCCRFLEPAVAVHLCVLMLLGVLHGAMTYRLPEFNDTPSNVTYYKGDKAILRCSVNHLGTKEVIWKKGTMEHVLTVGAFVFVEDTDVQIAHLPHQKEWNLIIRNVQPRHAGMYECQVSTKEDIRRYVQLNVKRDPLPRREAIKITGKAYVEKGDRIELTCNATGEFFPPEDIDWFKDGTKVKQDQYRGISIVKFRIAETKTLHSQLEIEHSDMKDNGKYICRSSDLAITSMEVMVLNGSAKRAKKKLVPDAGYGRWNDAETNQNKRENPSSVRSCAAHMTSLSRDFLTYLLCMVTLLRYATAH